MRQKTDETAMEFLRRVVHNLDYEHEYILDDLLSVQAILDYAELQSVYDTEFLEGILESIQEGDDAKPFLDFCEKYGLGWKQYLDSYDDLEEYDGQPDWQKEWEDFGEVYSDENDTI
jgi:hypothetical protein